VIVDIKTSLNTPMPERPVVGQQISNIHQGGIHICSTRQSVARRMARCFEGVGVEYTMCELSGISNLVRGAICSVGKILQL